VPTDFTAHKVMDQEFHYLCRYFPYLESWYPMSVNNLKTAIFNAVVLAALALQVTNALAKNPPVSTRLASAVVQSTDLSAEWSEDGELAPEWVPPPVCGVAFSGVSAGLFTSFRDTDNGFVQSVALQFPRGRAEKILTAISAKLKKGCTQAISGGEGEAPVKVRVIALSVPLVGSQRAGVRIDSPVFTTEALIARKGDVLVFVSSSRFAGKPASIAEITSKLTKRFLNG
jgi:hypothetical protein